MAPGDSTVVELIFKSKSYKRKMKKYATIYSNDPDQPTVKIHFSTVIDPTPDTSLSFTYTPPKTSLSQQSKKSKIIIENHGDSKLYIKKISPEIEGLSLKIKGDKVKPGKKSEIRFQWKGEFEKENIEHSLTFIAYGDKADTTRFTIPVVVNGTDPTPPKVVKAKRKSAKSARNKSTIRKPSPGTKSSSVRTKVAKTSPLTNTKQLPDSKKSSDEKNTTPTKDNQ